MRTIVKQDAFPASPQKKRVAAYARVSGGDDDMKHSLSAQISHYSNTIQRRIDWEFAGVYADCAATGTKNNRAGFQQMLTDCRAGKVDMVITKSVTRFARNTVTTLESVRELKLLNVDVFFEKENIHSMSGDGELMLSILASYAQEESRSASENCKWRIRKKFQEGRPHSVVLMGYRVENGRLVIVPEETEIVRMIFSDYLSGMGFNAIAKKLTAFAVPTLNGGNWRENTIRGMLCNEKYAGDILLQKWFLDNHINKKKCRNNGELPMYRIENAHEPIIDKDIFTKVQAELARRAAIYSPPKAPVAYPFTGKIICGICGKHYTRKIANAGSPYQKAAWICGTFDRRGKTACSSRKIPEDILLSIVDMDFKEILVPSPGVLVIITPDGAEIEKRWQHKSRRESWTPEMRQSARERKLRYYAERRKHNEQ